MTNQIKIKQKTTDNITFQFVDNDNAPIDITGYTLFFTVNEDLEATDDTSAVISETITSFSNATGGEHILALSSSDTDLTPKSYYFDYGLLSGAGDLDFFDYGAFIITDTVTKRRS